MERAEYLIKKKKHIFKILNTTITIQEENCKSSLGQVCIYKKKNVLFSHFITAQGKSDQQNFKAGMTHRIC